MCGDTFAVLTGLTDLGESVVRLGRGRDRRMHVGQRRGLEG